MSKSRNSSGVTMLWPSKETHSTHVTPVIMLFFQITMNSKNLMTGILFQNWTIIKI
jgi:hypothetical protein